MLLGTDEKSWYCFLRLGRFMKLFQKGKSANRLQTSTLTAAPEDLRPKLILHLDIRKVMITKV